ncbi:cytochrome P450 26A1-like [Mercenaria mercenaria]|uniref:cytochrome P450 26A1-like n=1 Tax=Mercenaria mercenaria TaxID=6596 RepID=UPI00234E867E|nr:cytochrome P450 26A1-like [Mercenaria mercenaria]
MVGKRSVKAAEIRGYIKTRCQLSVSAKEIFDELCVVHGQNEVSYATVTRWIKKFNSGCDSINVHQIRDVLVVLLLTLWLTNGMVYTAYIVSFMLRHVAIPFVLFVTCKTLWKWYVTSTRDSTCSLPLPPGGYGLPFIGETIHMLILGKAYFENRRKEYGDVYKTHLLGKPTIRVIGAEGVKQILRGENTIVQTQWPVSTCILLGEGAISHAVGDSHITKKRAIMKAFTFDALSRYLPVIQETTRKYIRRWCQTKRILGYKQFKTMNFDLSCRLMIGFQGNETECQNLMQIFETFISNIFCIPVDIKGSGFRKALQARDILLQKIDEVIQDRQGHEDADASDVLTTILNARSSHDLTISGVKNFCLELLFAGHGTTSSAAAFLVYVLAKHPEVVRKLKDEFEAFGVLDETNIDTDLKKLNKMTYLNNVVKELLRLSPPVGGGFRKAIKTFEVNGYQVPKGWAVTYAIRDTHEVSEHFEDATEFKPERWENFFVKNNQFLYLPFGGGRRACAGKDLARLMLKIFALELVKGCEWSLENDIAEFETFPMPHPKDGLPLLFKSSAQYSES